MSNRRRVWPLSSRSAATVRTRAALATVRTRVTLAAGLALTLAVGLGLVLLYLLQVGSAHRTTNDQLLTYAAQIEQSGQNGGWPKPLPTFSLDSTAQAQVLAADATVLASSRALEGMGAVYTLPAGSTAPVQQNGNSALTHDARVTGSRVTVHGVPVVVITFTSTDELREINETFSRLLLIGLPGILLMACGTVWLVVGRALGPVERIRRTVTEITAADLSRRVPEPGSRDEIGQLARTMNAMLVRLDDSSERQRRFVADASHELRSPLAAIRTSLEVGLAHPDTAPWPEIAQRAVRQSERLETLVQELLVLAKSDARQLAAARRPVDLVALVEEVRATSPSTQIAIDIAVDIGVEVAGHVTVLVPGDPEHLSRMVRNILDNAVRYAEHRVLITITAAPTAGQTRVEIADDGPGLPPEERERVFDRFVRLDASRERGSGSSGSRGQNGSNGLGLAIAKEIATAHGGAIRAAEAPTGGALIVITLPHA